MKKASYKNIMKKALYISVCGLLWLFLIIILNNGQEQGKIDQSDQTMKEKESPEQRLKKITKNNKKNASFLKHKQMR